MFRFFQAFDLKRHPLGRLVNRLVDVFRASYVGMGTHRRLLPHAVAETKSFVIRVYSIVRYDEDCKQSVFLRIQVRASSQTKGLERGCKQRARLGRDAKNFFLSPHTPVGRVRLARFARVRLLRHALPISLLILRKKPTVSTVLQSRYDLS